MKKSSLQAVLSQEMEVKTIFRQAMDYAFQYADAAPERNVFPTTQALDNADIFDEPLPTSRGESTEVLKLLHQYGSPATVTQIGGRYFGMVTGGVLPVTLAVKWLTDFWDQNTPLYITSPIASKLESVVEKWLNELLGLPKETVAGFVSGSSLAIFCGLAAARFRLLQNAHWDVNNKGLYGAPPLRIVAGRHAHATVLKAVALLGMGKDNIEWVECDSQGRIIPEAIPTLDERTILLLQAGNVNSGAFDDFANICQRARGSGAWIHVDGAFGLWAAAADKLKHLTQGMEMADSWSVDGHKTLNTPYDNGIVLCRDAQALTAALQASGSYIIYGDQRDGMLYTPEMSRRARVFELWAALKFLGKQGTDELVYQLHERAASLAAELRANHFDVPNEVVFNQVLVRLATDEQTDRVMKEIQKSGECWCGGATWDGKKVIRISVSSWATNEDDISRTIKVFSTARDANQQS
jgi:glutamate/tyrosine decarboxylase-like PLP-dependent enzyme